MRQDNTQTERRNTGNEGCSFEVKICTTQYATWQGYIRWIEKRRQQEFRSALDMLTLMDEALTDTFGEDATPVVWR